MYFKRAAITGALTFSIVLAGCHQKNPSEGGHDLNVSITEPVEFDYDAIRDRGTLRMITRYSSSTYFLHRGVEWGFEYELVRKFAEERNLALEVIIAGPDENLYNLLNSGKGDIIAANYAVTPERQKYVSFTRPYNLANQVVVYSSELKNPPQSVEALAKSGIAISVRRNSAYHYHLMELREKGFEIKVNIVSGDDDIESLLFDIARGACKATIADDYIFQASNKYMDGLVEGPTISQKDTIAWAVRKNAPNLETELNRFLYRHFRFGSMGEPPKRSAFLNVLREKYFKEGPQIAGYFNPESPIFETGLMFPYGELIKSVADSAGLDWLMIASMIAQETNFNPKSESWAGAVGLMQIMPRFSEIKDHRLLFDAEINLREGVRIISEHLNHYSYMDSTSRWAFALAAYNAGPGHVADARRLAIDSNNNPNKWEHTADALLKLMKRKYYKNARYGFCRGIETVRYVQEVLNRHQTYESVWTMAMAEQDRNSIGPGIIGMLNAP